MINCLIERKFNTPIGTVICNLTSNFENVQQVETKQYKNGESFIYETSDFIIELIEFKIRQPLPYGETVIDTLGWLWRMEKKRDNSEKLNIVCELTDIPENVNYGIATGEHLDAIGAENSDWSVHIGTEDGEVLQWRAKQNDWMPSRFYNLLNDSSFTKINPNGVETNIPELSVNEKIQFHYLTAYDKYEKDKIGTWNAVDEFKEELEKWIGIE